MLDPDSTSAPSSMPPPVTPTLVRRECHIALWRRRPFTEGEEVFVTNPSDGVLYFGIVVEVSHSDHGLRLLWCSDYHTVQSILDSKIQIAFYTYQPMHSGSQAKLVD